METCVEFRSHRFPQIAGEGKEINPGIWGNQLADFLRDNLRRQGFETEEPILEDWGWVVPVVNPQFRLWIGCSCYPEYPDGFLCFIEPHTPSVRQFFRKIDTTERVSSLRLAMDTVLNEGVGIRDKRWWTHEEFNNPARATTG